MPYADPERAKQYRKDKYQARKAAGLIDKKDAVKRVLRYVAKHRDQVNTYRREYWGSIKDQVNTERREKRGPEYHAEMEKRRRERMDADPALKERRLQSHRDSYARRSEKCKLNAKNWAASHPEQVKEYKITGVANRRACGGKYTTAQWLFRFAYYGSRCAYCLCNISTRKAHRDHVLAQANGGGNWACNLVPACSSCNLHKGVKRWVPKQPKPHGPLPC